MPELGGVRRNVPPAIFELVRSLPPFGSVMSKRDKELHRIAMAALVELNYPEPVQSEEG